MHAEPTAEHAWLQQLVGEWDAETRMNPEKPDELYRGRETGRALGPLWVQLEGQCETPGGGGMTMQMTLGYDPARQRFVGTWVGSVMTELWVYDIVREGENRLVMSVEGPSMTGEGRANYRDIIEWLSPDHRTLTGWAEQPNGEWSQFMRADYHRRR